MSWYRAFLAAAASALFLLAAVPASSGEIFTPCLGKGCDKQVLSHVRFKSVVLQLVDPAGEGLGETLSRLAWRELLFAISDMQGAGVILGLDFENTVREEFGLGTVDLLDERLHEAAAEIGKHLKTQMSLWGAVLSEGTELTLYSFLTLNSGGDWRREFALTLGDEHVPPVLRADFLQSRVAFAPIRTSLESLLFGPVAVRCWLSSGCPQGIPSYSEPKDGLAPRHHLEQGQIVRVTGARGKWLAFELPDGSTEFMNIYHADVAPRQVVARGRTGVGLRSAPDARSALVARIDLDGRFEVLGLGRGAADVPWYRIRTKAGEGWIGGWLVEPVYRFPFTHFMAALYRYDANQLDRAEIELGHFLESVPAEERVTRSFGLQLLAAIRAQRAPVGARATRAVLGPIQEALELTPFDPTIYNVRALIHFSALGGGDAAIHDLTRSVELDPSNAQTKRLVGDLWSIAEKQDRRARSMGLEAARMGALERFHQ